MRAVKHAKCNTVLRGGAPHIPDLHIKRGDESDDGSMPTVTSFWIPTKEELQELLDGGAVEVVILGYTHPPISVRTQP
jgi:hypothetical protein